VSNGALDVLAVHAFIEINGSGEALDKGVGGFAKTATPKGAGGL
jgi:hypothetical protein